MMTTSTIKGVNSITRELATQGARQATARATNSSINWESYNYPPFLHIMHFEPSELEGGSRIVVRWAHRAYLIVLLGLFINCAAPFAAIRARAPSRGASAYGCVPASELNRVPLPRSFTPLLSIPPFPAHRWLSGAVPLPVQLPAGAQF
jgi:hypothetical protein